MGKVNINSKCSCGSSIEIDEYHNAGGENDKYLVIYQCDKCTKKGYIVAKNFNQGAIKGASVISCNDMELIENANDLLRTYLRKHLYLERG
jgi:hypothetical protein